MIGTGSMSDPYMHCEENLKLTRRCLEIILKNEFGVAIQTKSDMILRDIDLLSEINKSAKCVVQMTLTTYDDEPATVAMMHAFMDQQGYELDITDKRLHHEIYLSDARKVDPEKLKTVIRHPIKVKGK